jgi:tetratricopeptide (TPR) repeat protein
MNGADQKMLFEFLSPKSFIKVDGSKRRCRPLTRGLLGLHGHFDGLLRTASVRFARVRLVCGVSFIVINLSLNTSLALAAGVSSVAAVELPNISSRVSRIGDATHIEFEGLSQWNYSIEKSEAGDIIFRIAGLRPEAIKTLAELKDPAILGVKLAKGLGQEPTEIRFQMTSNDIEYFDYTSSEPSKLILDFFPRAVASASESPSGSAANEGGKISASTAANVKKSIGAGRGAKGSSVASKSQSSTQNSPQTLRKIASDYILPEASLSEKFDRVDAKFGLFDGGDPEFKRFRVADYEVRESAILASRDNIYISFPMLELSSPTLKAIGDSPATYEIIPKENSENEKARVLLVLFKNERNAILIQTAKSFLEKYPESQYDEIVRYMMADSYYRMWNKEHNPADFEAAMSIYRALSERYPDSPLQTRTLLLMGYSFVSKGDSFAALKSFQRFNRLFPNSKYHDQVRVAMAEAYVKVGRFDDAAQLLKNIESETKDIQAKHDAAFRIGDVYFKRGEFEKSIAEYQRAVLKYPEVKSQYGNASYNSAEAKFQLRQFQPALASYVDFLKSFAPNSHSGYAMTRVGETLEILGVNPKRAMGAFLECLFRYRGHPGASLARLHFLTTRFPDLNTKELESAVNEIEKLTIDMSKLADFQDVPELTTLVLADGLGRRGDYTRAAEILIQKYKLSPQSPHREKYHKRIVHNLTQKMKTAVGADDFMTALKVYSGNQTSWLKDNQRIDTDYLAGQAFEKAGVFSDAKEMYTKTATRVAAIRGKSSEKEHLVYEKLPSPEQVSLRLAAVELGDRDYAGAMTSLQKIKDKGTKSLAPAELAEKADIHAQLAEQQGQTESAISYLKEIISNWSQDKKEAVILKLRLARLLIRGKQTTQLAEADRELAQVLELDTEKSPISEEQVAQALQLRGEAALLRGAQDESIESFEKLLKKFEAKKQLASVRYQLGKIYFEKGNLTEAESTWKQLSEQTDPMWKKLAQEQMTGQKWQREYKKYIDRIPAAAEMRSKQ